jgi:CRISPR-associated protein cas1
LLKSVAIIVVIYYNNRVRDALHSYLNLAEATKIRLHAEINTLSFYGRLFSLFKKEKK